MTDKKTKLFLSYSSVTGINHNSVLALNFKLATTLFRNSYPDVFIKKLFLKGMFLKMFYVIWFKQISKMFFLL